MDGSHLRMHAHSDIGTWKRLLKTAAVQQSGVGRSLTGINMAAVVARAKVVETLANDLATLDDDAAVAIAKGRQRGLLEANVEISVRLHDELDGWIFVLALTVLLFRM